MFDGDVERRYNGGVTSEILHPLRVAPRRRYTAKSTVTLPLRCRHTAVTLQLRCRYTTCRVSRLGVVSAATHVRGFRIEKSADCAEGSGNVVETKAARPLEPASLRR